MTRLVADTHAVLWYLYGDARLSAAARKAFDDAAPGCVSVSAITLVEVRYLEEKGRLVAGAYDAIRDVLRDPVSPFALAPLTADIADALGRVPRQAVPDLPDRVIAATAVSLGVPLVTRDARIVASAVPTVW